MGFIPFGELDEDTMASLTDTERARVARLGAYMSDGNGAGSPNSRSTGTGC
jgi:hypothetical protein